MEEMIKKYLDIAGGIIIICGFTFCVFYLISHFLIGDGGFKRLTTLSGMYAVCKPGGDDVVCFSGKGNDGIACIPLNQVGGSCVK